MKPKICMELPLAQTGTAGTILLGTEGSAFVLEQGNITGLRNPSSSSNSYLVVKQETNVMIINTTAAVTIGAGAANDTYLLGISMVTALAGACTIAGFLNNSSSAQNYVFPAATPAGYKDFLAAINGATALTVTIASAADTGNVAVFWRPI